MSDNVGNLAIPRVIPRKPARLTGKSGAQSVVVSKYALGRHYPSGAGTAPIWTATDIVSVSVTTSAGARQRLWHASHPVISMRPPVGSKPAGSSRPMNVPAPFPCQRQLPTVD